MPTSNYCTNGYTPLLKTVVGIPNDIITITKTGIFINQRLVKNSLAMVSYHHILLSPSPTGYTHKLAYNEYWLSGNGNNSYDSRYFGFITSAEIVKRAMLILPIRY